MRRRVRRLVRRVMGFLAGRSVRTALMAAATVVGAGVVAWLWERGPNLAQGTRDGLSPAEQIQAVGQYHTTLIQASAAVGGAIALGYTARNYRLSRRGQTTDRFTKALERLGSTDLYVRLGAVYALEQVLRDSPELQADVVDVLVAFVRTHTRLTASTRVCRNTVTHQGTYAVALSVLPEPFDHPAEPHADIQAALTALGRLPHHGRPTTQLNLTDLHLAQAQLVDANLTNAQLDGANLTRAQLVGADLTRAKLAGADLTRAELAGANLAHAQLPWADLSHAWLGGVDFTGAWLGWVNLTRARLDESNFTDAQLERANLTRARLDGANLTHARLGEVNLTRARLLKTRMTSDQANTASHADRAELPAHLIWDPRHKQVRDATAEETAAAETEYRRHYPWY